ncbi:RluB protein [Mediterraneibacter glycyrrhizinilyticus]|nr:RluB protein [Mediterraneibacter glycyrrhizinilyticus]
MIDDADHLLTDGMRRYIALDKKNQYLIAGKNTDNLLVSRANLYELDVVTDGVKTEIRLRNCMG